MLRLTAIKSSLGHAEPAAGSIAIAHVAFMLENNRSSSIMHLRNVNSLVLGALNTNGRATTSMPRQSTPSFAVPILKSSCLWNAIQGVSSFAFQGTNAHAVICLKYYNGPASDCGLRQDVAWYKVRYWYSTPSHILLYKTTSHAKHKEAVFESKMTRACLGVPLYIFAFHTLYPKSLVPSLSHLYRAFSHRFP